MNTRRALWASAVLLALVTVLGVPSTAYAGAVTLWRSAQPKGVVTTNLPITVQGSGASNGFPLVSTSLKLFIDGALVPRGLYSGTVGSTSVYVYYNPTTPLADGPHVFRVEVSDTTSRLSYYEWSATMAQPPSATWVAPSAGATLNTGLPTVVMALSDNTPGTAFIVSGQAHLGSAAGTVAATFGGVIPGSGNIPFTLSAELAPGTYYLTASVTDSAGNTRVVQGTAARQFSTHAPATMTVLESCDGCHAPIRAAHPTTVDCAVCHQGYDGDHMEGTDYCEDCHYDGWHAEGAGAVVAISGTCVSCHSAERPEVTQHTAGSVGPTHASSCDGCHRESLLARHDGTAAGSAYPHQCDRCHASTDPVVVAAIASGDASCDACHDAVPGHGYNEAMHTAPTEACVGAGCHATKLLREMHTPYVGPGNRHPQYEDACQLCHANEDPDRVPEDATADCATCHPDRTTPHGYDPVDHISTEACLGSCHEAELKPEHETIAVPISCSGCHPVEVAAVSPWDKSCGACHEVIAHTSAQHTGTDVAYQAVSFFGSGCSGSTGHTEQLFCHDISNLGTLHYDMPGHGCQVCHGTGKTPAPECLDCHKPGYATSYTVPGTPSANIVASQSPSSDNFITAGLTYTTTPAGQPVYSVVNTPWSSGTPARFVTITSNTAGDILVGYDGLSLPSNSRIVAVEVYSRGKSTTASPLRKMQGVFKIGGQTYLSSGTGTSLTASWTATTGGARYSSPSTRIDYTREPLYGEMIWRNPATGQDWTVAELTGTDPDSSLEAYGVNLTASATTNNISLAQIYVKVTYYTVGEPVTNPTVGTHTYHGNNVKYLVDPSDAPAGQRFMGAAPAHGWYEALYYQDCNDFCHRGNYGAPTYSANQGQWMWYSVGGDPSSTGNAVRTRTLTLREITIPAASPLLTFKTQYILGAGDTGAVQISTDNGGTWTPLSGTVGGATLSGLTGSSSGWVSASYDLSAYAGQSAKLRFKYYNSASSGTAGWAFDTLEVSTGGVPVFSDDAETLKPDWTNQYWTRSMGAFPY